MTPNRKPGGRGVPPSPPQEGEKAPQRAGAVAVRVILPEVSDQHANTSAMFPNRRTTA